MTCRNEAEGFGDLNSKVKRGDSLWSSQEALRVLDRWLKCLKLNFRKIIMVAAYGMDGRKKNPGKGNN